MSCATVVGNCPRSSSVRMGWSTVWASASAISAMASCAPSSAALSGSLPRPSSARGVLSSRRRASVAG